MMTDSNVYSLNSKLDLTFERIVDVPKDVIWKAWTMPEHLKKWFTPSPWTTIDCEIDLRPGGIFRTVMRSPEGEEFPNLGCYLEIVENEKLVWTNTLLPGYRPAHPPSENDFFLTATIALAAQGSGTKYTAIVLHGNEESCNKHRAMGFEEGWGKALEQLVIIAQEI
jgi:uncharacterized protein YndB with AHSA1/START domain